MMKKIKSDSVFGDKYTHPSFGKLTFNRVQGMSQPLFGSSIKHHNFISLTIQRAEYNRNISTDYVFGTETLLEAEMSATQFADIITGLNSGSGNPITLRYIKGEGRVEPPEYVNKRKQFESEFMQTATDTLDRISKLDKKIKERKLPKWVNEELGIIISWYRSNIPFVAEQFDKQMDKSVTEAKGEIEAYVSNMVTQLGIKALKEQAPQLPEGKEGRQ